jgi:hypothetical protein
MIPTETAIDVYHGTTSRTFRSIRPKLQYDAGYPAIFTTSDRRFASQFADGKNGRLLHFKLDLSGFVDFASPQHIERVCTKLAQLLTPLWRRPVTEAQAQEQLHNRLHANRIDWSYHYGMKAIWQSGFSGAKAYESDSTTSYVSFDASTLRLVDVQRPEPM